MLLFLKFPRPSGHYFRYFCSRIIPDIQAHTLIIHRQKFCLTDAAHRPFSRDLLRVSKLTTQPPFTLRIKRGWKYYSPPCLECMEDKPCSYYVGGLWKFKGGSISHHDKLELPSNMFHNWWWVNHSWERGRTKKPIHKVVSEPYSSAGFGFC